MYSELAPSRRDRILTTAVLECPDKRTECYPQVAIAGFSDKDPGSSSIAQKFFAHMRDDVTLGALDFPSQIVAQNFNDLQASIPLAFAMGTQNCYTKCGITPPSKSTRS